MNVNNMAFYISGPKLLFETTEISTHPNSTQQESNYIYLYTTKFGTSIQIRLNRKFESTEFETIRSQLYWYFRSLKRFWDWDFNFVNVLDEVSKHGGTINDTIKRVLIWRFTLVLIKIIYGQIGDQKGSFIQQTQYFRQSVRWKPMFWHTSPSVFSFAIF